MDLNEFYLKNSGDKIIFLRFPQTVLIDDVRSSGFNEMCKHGQRDLILQKN